MKHQSVYLENACVGSSFLIEMSFFIQRVEAMQSLLMEKLRFKII